MTSRTRPAGSEGATPGRRTVLVTAAAGGGRAGRPGRGSGGTRRRRRSYRAAAAAASSAADRPAPVGVRASYAVDATRPEPVTGGPRTLPVHLWYPAPGRRSRAPGTAPYLSPVLRPVYEAAFGVPPGTLAIDTHADAGARPLPARGVLLMSGGLGLPTAFQTAQATELASHGWAVVAVEHPHDTYRTELPGGVVVERTLPDTAEGGRAAFAPGCSTRRPSSERLHALVPGRAPARPFHPFLSILLRI
jgi:hypothetical protein